MGPHLLQCHGPVTLRHMPRREPHLREIHDEHGLKQLWVGVDVDDGWRADLRLALQDDRLVVSEVRLYPSMTEAEAKLAGISPSVRDTKEFELLHEPGDSWKRGQEQGLDAEVPAGGISARLLRRVPVHVHERMDTQRLAVLKITPRGDEEVIELHTEGELILLQHQHRSDAPRRRGRPRLDDATLLRVAATYAEAYLAGAHPTQTVRRKLRMSQARARDLVRRARERGFLTHATWGRAGGKLTAEAERLLSASKEPSDQAGKTKTAHGRTKESASRRKPKKRGKGS